MFLFTDIRHLLQILPYMSLPRRTHHSIIFTLMKVMAGFIYDVQNMRIKKYQYCSRNIWLIHHWIINCFLPHVSTCQFFTWLNTKSKLYFSPHFSSQFKIFKFHWFPSIETDYFSFGVRLTVSAQFYRNKWILQCCRTSLKDSVYSFNI